jgi:hypothetical protein
MIALGNSLILLANFSANKRIWKKLRTLNPKHYRTSLITSNILLTRKSGVKLGLINLP